MRYHLGDVEADPRMLLVSPQQRYDLADVVDAETSPARAVLQGFVNAFQPRQLAELQELTAAGVGFGVEIASSMYDDDLEPGDEPFEGVLVIARFRGDEIILSRAAYKRLVDAMVALGPRRG